MGGENPCDLVNLLIVELVAHALLQFPPHTRFFNDAANSFDANAKRPCDFLCGHHARNRLNSELIECRCGCGVRGLCFTRRMSEDDSMANWWIIVPATVSALLLILLAGFGYGQGWGASQWGPVSAWFSSLLTFGAVSLALFQAFRSERSRRVEHELDRRRECLKAVGDVWAGLAQMSLYFTFFTDYLQNLPAIFNPNLPRQDNVPPDHPGDPIAYDISGRVENFVSRWTELVEPPLFIALALLKNTPFDEPMKDINKGIRDLLEKELFDVLKVGIVGQRPDITTLDQKWKALVRKREEHLNLTRKHFSLDLKSIEAELRN